MINTIIFSKDRACQLELLLRSLKRNFVEWEHANVSIVYKVSGEGTLDNPLYQGYMKCKELHPEFLYLPEEMCESFKDATLSGINPENPLTMFLVDDDVFKDRFSLLDPEFQKFAVDQDILTLSLRLYPGVDYCYPIARNVRVPVINEDGTWKWNGEDGDWGYPMSVDGNVFSTPLIRYIVENLPFKNPNTFESAMAVNTQVVASMPNMICYKDNSKLLNVPANIVQNTFANRVGNLFSTEELNVRFLNGEKISLEPFMGMKNKAPHTEIEYTFEK